MPALVGQGTASLANLVIALIAARALAPASFGTFALLIAVLTFLIAIQSSWVGDYLTVVGIAAADALAVQFWQQTLTIICSTAAGVLCLVWADVPLKTAVVFACLTYAWLQEEFGRRYFMAQRRFGRQALNDGVYLLVACGTALAVAVTGTLTLTRLLMCMTGGAVVATLAAQPLLRSEFRWRPWVTPAGGVAAVADYGAWRAAQSSVGAAGQVAVRRIVILMAGLPALANLELARIVVAPLMTAMGGLANVLLPTYAEAHRENREVHHARALGAMVFPLVAYGIVAVTWAEPITQLLAGEKYHVDRIAVVGWLVAVTAATMCQPNLSRALVVVAPRRVFLARSGATLAGLMLALVAIPLTSAAVVPYCLAVGPLLSVLLLRQRRRPARCRRTNHDRLRIAASRIRKSTLRRRVPKGSR